MLADNGALSVAMAASGGRQKPNRKHRAIFFFFLNVWSGEDCWQANNVICEMLQRSRSKNRHRRLNRLKVLQDSNYLCWRVQALIKEITCSQQGYCHILWWVFHNSKTENMLMTREYFQAPCSGFLTPIPTFFFCYWANYFITQIWPNVLQEADSLD